MGGGWFLFFGGHVVDFSRTSSLYSKTSPSAFDLFLQEYFVAGFNVLLPTLTTQLKIPAASTTWPASAFPLTVGSFLLIFGRLADMYGGYIVFILGLGWLSVWSLIAGFSQNQLMLNFCRAGQGLGPAAFLPSGLMLLGSIYRPGPRKNLALVFMEHALLAAISLVCFAPAWLLNSSIGDGISGLEQSLPSSQSLPHISPCRRRSRHERTMELEWTGQALFSR